MSRFNLEQGCAVLDNNSEMSFVSHLAELRTRLLVSFLFMAIFTVFGYLFSKEIYGFLLEPMVDAVGEREGFKVSFFGLPEAFLTYLKVSIFFGVFLSAPIFLFHIWRFVSPGLYQREKKSLLPFIIASPLLFYLGGVFFYYVAMPYAWDFFISFESGAGETNGVAVELTPRISEYLSLVMTFILAFGLCFQLPVIIGVMGKTGIVNADFLRKKRKLAIIGAFVAGAIFTPADIVSQFFLAVPIVLFYELSIIIVAMQSSHKKNSVV